MNLCLTGFQACENTFEWKKDVFCLCFLALPIFLFFNRYSFYFFLLQHSCVKARVNGRDGVIVAGGASDADPSLNMVEFFDLRSHKWMSLGRTRQGRRFTGKEKL